jgi:hypothetical protein
MIKLNKKTLFSGLLIGFLFLISSPSIGQAAFEKSERNIYIGPEQIIEGNFIVAGGIIDFNGQAQKDVIVAGGTINITGPVQGDVIVAGGTVKIKGEISGNVRVVGGTIEIDSKIGKNLNAFGGIVIINQDAEIGWDVLTAGGSIEIRGKIGGDIIGRGENIILAGEVGGNVDFNLESKKDSQLILYPQAKIGGDLIYSSPQKAEIKEGAEIGGETIYKRLIPSAVTLKKSLGISYFISKIIILLSLLLIGLLIVVLAQKQSKTTVKRMLDKPWNSLGWGSIYLIIIPIILILVFMTVIGIPLAFIVFTLYLIVLYMAKIFVGIVLGQKLLQWWTKKSEISLVWAMILGVIIFSILTDLPFVGWAISLLGTCWALGAILEIKKQTFKQIEE